MVIFAAAAPAQAPYDLIRKGPGHDWLTYAGDYAGHRHSPLAQITRENVATLVPKWVYHVEKSSHLEATH
jgi:glucose dehydrogenase